MWTVIGIITGIGAAVTGFVLWIRHSVDLGNRNAQLTTVSDEALKRVIVAEAQADKESTERKKVLQDDITKIVATSDTDGALALLRKHFGPGSDANTNK